MRNRSPSLRGAAVNDTAISLGRPERIRSGTVLRIRADLGMSTSGSNITAWADQSGLTNNGTPSGTPTLTASAINAKPAATFLAASSQYVSFPNAFQALTASEIFIVNTSTATGVGMHNFGNSAGVNQLYPWSDTHVYDNYGSTTRNDCGIPASSLATAHIYNARTSSTEYTLVLTTTPLFTTGTNTVGWGVGPAIGGSTGSGGATPTTFFTGFIGEVVMYSRIINASERNRLTSYMKAWYGLS